MFFFSFFFFFFAASCYFSQNFIYEFGNGALFWSSKNTKQCPKFSIHFSALIRFTETSQHIILLRIKDIHFTFSLRKFMEIPRYNVRELVMCVTVSTQVR